MSELEELARERGWRPPGATLLDEVERLLRRYLAMSEEAFVVVVLWIVHTHTFDAFDTTPYLVLASPAPQCGKTVTLELLELLVREPVRDAISSPAAIFRLIELKQPTILFDEYDAIFGGRGDYEALRGVINMGYRRGGTVHRCVGEGSKMEVKEFPTYCPKALAGIGTLPATIVDRALVITMQRKRPDQQLAKFRPSRPPNDALRLRDQIATWAQHNIELLRYAEPALPDELDGRGQDVAEPLLAIANSFGGTWPLRARNAILALKRNSDIATTETHAVRLLADIQHAFANDTVIATAELINRLCADDEAPWRDWKRAGPIDPRGFAKLLKSYAIKSTDVRTADGTRKGYRRDQFTDAWARYLPSKGDISDISDIPHSSISQLSPLSPLSPIPTDATELAATTCIVCEHEYEIDDEEATFLRCSPCATKSRDNS